MSHVHTKDSSQNIENELNLFEALASTPETTQADLSVRVGVAVGTVNWYLQRWSKKGYIKVQRVGRWNWRYLLTPAGLARKHQLAREYIIASFALYRRIRQDAQTLLAGVVGRGQMQVVLSGHGEIAEICRLTCLELQLEVVDRPTDAADMPILHVDGIRLSLQWPSPRDTAIDEQTPYGNTQ